MAVHRIGVLTSGGDTPGMNAAVRAVVRRGLSFGDVVLGVYHGYEGLMSGNVKQLQSADVHGVIQRGGTILRTARSEGFKTKEGQKKAVKLMEAYEMDSLVVVGGDGSFRGAEALSKHGVNVMGIPGTIDNDMGYTDFTIGFDTAVNNVISELEKIRDTMRSHDRVAVVEVMGRACGDIALWSGMVGPTDIVLAPECP
ncbi:MAG: ATP-dependent 6-phosphofructokinase, partial [Clostridia bacterium]|nr:ATP-dependent 6-phosphofructokinase [Clostridia bacterium]